MTPAEVEGRRLARLEAVAVVEAIGSGRQADALAVLGGTDDALELAHAACSMAAGVLSLLPADHRDAVLSSVRAAAVRE